MKLTFNSEFNEDVSIYAARLLYNHSLRVGLTSLPGCSFLGLYTSRDFKMGDIVCKYVGKRMRTAEAIKSKDKSYLMRLGEQSYVDAEPHKAVFARYINDCLNPRGWNVEFVKNAERGYALVVAVRNIACGEEVFVSYGKRYWMLQKPVKLSDIQLRDLKKKNLSNNQSKKHSSHQYQ